MTDFEQNKEFYSCNSMDDDEQFYSCEDLDESNNSEIHKRYSFFINQESKTGFVEHFYDMTQGFIRINNSRLASTKKNDAEIASMIKEIDNKIKEDFERLKQRAFKAQLKDFVLNSGIVLLSIATLATFLVLYQGYLLFHLEKNFFFKSPIQKEIDVIQTEINKLGSSTLDLK